MNKNDTLLCNNVLLKASKNYDTTTIVHRQMKNKKQNLSLFYVLFCPINGAMDR